MATTSVRIRKADHEVLREMAAEDELTLTDELGRLIDEKRRERFIEAANREMAAIKENDPEAWEDLQEEYRSLEGTLADGLDEWPWEEGDEE